MRTQAPPQFLARLVRSDQRLSVDPPFFLNLAIRKIENFATQLDLQCGELTQINFGRMTQNLTLRRYLFARRVAGPLSRPIVIVKPAFVRQAELAVGWVVASEHNATYSHLRLLLLWAAYIAVSPSRWLGTVRCDRPAVNNGFPQHYRRSCDMSNDITRVGHRYTGTFRHSDIRGQRPLPPNSNRQFTPRLKTKSRAPSTTSHIPSPPTANSTPILSTEKLPAQESLVLFAVLY